MPEPLYYTGYHANFIAEVEEIAAAYASANSLTVLEIGGCLQALAAKAFQRVHEEYAPDDDGGEVE